jgi:hypothetical protein
MHCATVVHHGSVERRAHFDVHERREMHSEKGEKSTMLSCSLHSSSQHIFYLRFCLLKVSNPTAIRLLCLEAYHNYIHSMYPSSEQDCIALSVIFMKIMNESFKVKEWKQFFASKFELCYVCIFKCLTTFFKLGFKFETCQSFHSSQANLQENATRTNQANVGRVRKDELAIKLSKSNG